MEERWLPWQANGMPATERGYLHTALAWVHAWDNETRERVLIERAYMLEKRSPLATLPYMVAHNDWRGIVRWINSLRLGKSNVDPYGRLCLHSSARWVSHNNKKHKRKKRHRRRQTSRESDNYCDGMDSQSPEFSKLIQKVKNVMKNEKRKDK